MLATWQVAIIASSGKMLAHSHMKSAPSQAQDKFIVRLPDGLREKIKASADANKRSMNAEMVRAVEFYLEFENRGAVEAEDELEIPQRVTSDADAERIAAAMARRYQRDLQAVIKNALRGKNSDGSEFSEIGEPPEGM